jgi:hypothetical protein
VYHQLCPDVKIEHMMEQRVNVKFCVKLQKSSTDQTPVNGVEIEELLRAKVATHVKV